MSRIAELLAVPAADWTPDLEQTLAILLVGAVSDGSVLRVDVPCDDPEQVAHVTGMSQRLQDKHRTVILSSGRVWDGQVMHWYWEGFPTDYEARVQKAKERQGLA